MSSAKAKYVLLDKTTGNGGGYGNRRRLAIIKLNAGYDTASRIDTRLKAVDKIEWRWDFLYHGKTQNCQYYEALTEASRILEALNG